MNEILSQQPILFAFLGLVALTALIMFALPGILKLRHTAFGKGLNYSFQHTAKLAKKHPVQTGILVAVGLVILAAGYFFYLSNQPIRIVGAGELKRSKGSALTILQNEGIGSFQKAKVYLIDARSREEWYQERLRGSVNIPKESAAREYLALPQIDLVVFSSESSFETAREVAETLQKNRESFEGGKHKKQLGKIWLVRDGYEGLVKSGLTVEREEPAL